jgi:hypothetical protein
LLLLLVLADSLLVEKFGCIVGFIIAADIVEGCNIETDNVLW